MKQELENNGSLKPTKVGAPTLLLLLALCCPAWTNDLPALVRDRTAIERVYYSHRLGQKPPFEQVSPPSLIERLVREDLRKETALKRVYHVVITPAMLQAEVQRINTTTRAPDMLAEAKAALGNDPAQFADAFAKPILVERLLRDKFDNDDALHAPQRRETEKTREKLLQTRSSRGNEALTQNAALRAPPSAPDQSLLTSAATNKVAELLTILKTNAAGQFSETTWQLTPRPAETNTPAADELQIKQRFGPDAQLISSPRREQDRQFYFEDLPADLQRVLRVQLRRPGDVSAVIETTGGFLLYVAQARSAAALTVACLSLPKRSYEQWLSEQDGGTP